MPEFSTASFPLRQKFDAWRNVITQQFLPLRPEPVRRARFWGEMRTGLLDTLAVVRVRARGQVVHRTGREISQSSPDALFVNVHVAGSSALACGNDVHRLSDGDLFFVDGHHPFRLHCEERMHHVVVAIPMNRVRALLRRPERAAGLVVPRGSGVAGLLSDYLIALEKEYDGLGPAAAVSVERHIAELAAHVLNERHSDVPLPREVVREALYKRACQIIEAEHGDASFSPSRLAQRMNLSVRFLHALFRGHGPSLMRHVYQTRIQHAAAMLSNPGFAHRSITEIAMNCGFSDLTHFGRAFAQAYQETPRSFRARFR